MGETVQHILTAEIDAYIRRRLAEALSDQAAETAADRALRGHKFRHGGKSEGTYSDPIASDVTAAERDRERLSAWREVAAWALESVGREGAEAVRMMWAGLPRAVAAIVADVPETQVFVWEQQCVARAALSGLLREAA